MRKHGLAVVLHSALVQSLPRSGCIHACEPMTIRLARFSFAQSPTTNEIILSNSGAKPNRLLLLHIELRIKHVEKDGKYLIVFQNIISTRINPSCSHLWPVWPWKILVMFGDFQLTVLRWSQTKSDLACLFALCHKNTKDPVSAGCIVLCSTIDVCVCVCVRVRPLACETQVIQNTNCNPDYFQRKMKWNEKRQCSTTENPSTARSILIKSHKFLHTNFE